MKASFTDGRCDSILEGVGLNMWGEVWGKPWKAVGWGGIGSGVVGGNGYVMGCGI